MQKDLIAIPGLKKAFFVPVNKFKPSYFKIIILLILAGILCSNSSKASGNNIDSLYTLLRKNKDTTSVFAFFDAIKPLRSQNPDSSLKWLLKAQSVVYATKDKKAIAVLQLNKGRDYNSIGEFDKAIAVLDSALKLCKQIKFKKGIASSTHNMGISYIQKGDLKKGLQNMIKAEEGFLEVNAIPEALSSQQAQGAVFLEMDNPKMAIKVFLRAEKTALEHKQEKSLLMIRTNIGSVYNKINDFDHAIAYYEMAIEQAKKMNDPYILLAASSNLGTIYFAQKKLDEAIAIELPALEIAKSMGDVTSEISIMNNLASAYSSKGDYKNGLIYADGALNLLKTNKSASALLHATINKADILYHLGKGNEAFELLKQHMAIKDSLLQADQQASLTEMEEKYNSYKQEQKIKDLNTSKQIGDLKLKESEQASTIYLLIAISAGLLLALVVVALIINRNKNKVLESKNKIIEENLKEKEILLMEVHHRVKNNLQMIYSILNMQSKNLPADVADILNENKDRIRSISIVHEKLYRNEDISNININELITDIAENARKSSPYSASTQIQVVCDPIKPDLDTMLSLGIMVNELVTNSFKYAFDQNKQNNIQISLRKKENMLFLKVNDNGRGFPVGFTPSESKSFGFKMLQTICKKLKGQINCQNSNGAQIEITMERFALLN